MELPNNVHNSIRCMTCQKVLSCFPIHSINDKTFICGRCPLPTDIDCKREAAYEAFAQYFKFNCIYFDNGCVEKLTPLELSTHEPSCPKKSYRCPIDKDCEWIGLEDEILEHMYSDHKKNYLDEYESFNLNTKDICHNYVMEFLNHAFLIILSSDETFAYFQVKLWGPRKMAVNFNYNFTLCNNDLKDGMDFPKLKVAAEDGNIGLDIKSAFKIELETIECLKSEELRCLFSISKEEISGKKDAQEIMPLNNSILEHLQCPVCFEHMISPIYQCGNGHCLCSGCKDSITNCPSCKIEIGQLRNRILEDITQYLLYECKFDGCTRKFYPKDKIDHETNCAYSLYKCFVPCCKWASNYATILHHFNESHYEIVKQNNTFHAYKDEMEVFDYILKYDTYTFLVHHLLADNNLYVRVDFFGPKDVENVFYYAVSIHGFGSKEIIYMRKKCFDDVVDNDLIKENSLVIPIKFIKHQEDFYVCYRIDIIE